MLGTLLDNKKTLTYEKDMAGYDSVSLPFVVGDVNVDALVEGNDENYQNSMLTELSLKAK